MLKRGPQALFTSPWAMGSHCLPRSGTDQSKLKLSVCLFSSTEDPARDLMHCEVRALTLSCIPSPLFTYLILFLLLTLPRLASSFQVSLSLLCKEDYCPVHQGQQEAIPLKKGGPQRGQNEELQKMEAKAERKKKGGGLWTSRKYWVPRRVYPKGSAVGQ